jgi:hypothetical protein
MKLEQGRFVNVVASVDLTSGDGDILYVTPSTTSIKPDGKPSNDFQLVAYDENGSELNRVSPFLRLSASTPQAGPMPANTKALIQEDMPAVSGTQRIVLLYKGQVKSEFRAGKSSAEKGGAMLGPPLPNQGNRRAASSDVEAEEGVTYAVQVKAENSARWNTIAVGQKTPAFEVDRNQFPGAKKAVVRVLRSTGVEQTIFSEDEVSLEY